uniref:Uncharacterized protein n=1 Tax=Anguilla anguilla TaxID=7936 RepID=A0A0E9PX92_ANGAN
MEETQGSYFTKLDKSMVRDQHSQINCYCREHCLLTYVCVFTYKAVGERHEFPHFTLSCVNL